MHGKTIKIKRDLRKNGVKMLTGLIWLQTATGGGFFSCSIEPQVPMKGEEFADWVNYSSSLLLRLATEALKLHSASSRTCTIIVHSNVI